MGRPDPRQMTAYPMPCVIRLSDLTGPKRIKTNNVCNKAYGYTLTGSILHADFG